MLLSLLSSGQAQLRGPMSPVLDPCERTGLHAAIVALLGSYLPIWDNPIMRVAEAEVATHVPRSLRLTTTVWDGAVELPVCGLRRAMSLLPFRGN